MKAVLEMLPSAPIVRRITIDLEKAIWSALGQLFPDVEIKGCAFHWNQALWQKVSVGN